MREVRVAREGGYPSIWAPPLLGEISPVSIDMVVVLPACESIDTDDIYSLACVKLVTVMHVMLPWGFIPSYKHAKPHCCNVHAVVIMRNLSVFF